MAIISVGYDGAVTESQWADMIKKIGSAEYGVVGLNDLKVTSVPASDRTVSISAGKAWGHGVFDENTASASVQLDPVASGSRWDLVALRRNWTGVGGATTLVKVNGTSAKEIPAGRSKGAGVIDDQPLALVQVVAGQSQPAAVVDLRCWSGNGGVIANNEMALSYMDSLASQVFINVNGKTYTRIIGIDGNPAWTVGAADGQLPLHGFGNTLAGGIPPLGAGFLIQAGTQVAHFDNSAYARVTFPKPFPNGLLFVAGFNGDDWATGGSLTFASAGQVWGTEGYGTKNSWVYAGRAQEASSNGTGSTVYNRLPMAGRIHRINWIAIGW